MYEDSLYHHGIKGQKWGVRRFQNKDGTLTNAGRKRNHVGVNSEELTSSAKEQVSNLQKTSRKFERNRNALLNLYRNNPEEMGDKVDEKLKVLESEEKRTYKEFIQNFEESTGCRIGLFQNLPDATCFTFSDGDRTWMAYKGTHFDSVKDVTEEKDKYPDTSNRYRD